MSKNNPELQKLLESASTATAGPEASLSAALENKIIVDWRRRGPVEAETWASSLFTPALVLASLFMLLSICFYEWKQSSQSPFHFTETSLERYLTL